MSRRVIDGVRTFGATVLAISALTSLATSAEAQTKVVLDAPKTEVLDTMVRGGSYARTNFDGEDLMTRASDNREYVRRALLKFDTEKYVPENAVIKSATLTLTVKGGNSETRRLSAYRVAQSFDAPAATWNERKDSSSWKAGGGDFGKKYDDASVTAKVGSKVTFDVTKLVQEAVNGDFGSRWTRIAVIDDGNSSRESYRVFYASEASSSLRPALTVVFQGSASAPPKPKPQEPKTPPPPPPPDPPSATGSTLRVLHWNLYHGQNAKKKWGFSRQMEVIAKAKPDLVSLNEVEKFNSTYGNIDQAAELARYLTEKTGTKWYQYMRVASGSSKGIGNAVLSRFPILATSTCQLSDDRNAVHISVEVNGRPVNLWSTHLAVESGTYRVAEARTLLACMDNFAEQRLVAGDFNANAGSRVKELTLMGADYTDTWAQAKSMGKTTNYSGNCDGCTRNTRIDYMFTSKSASKLALRSAQMIDTRDSKGTMASDHKPMVAVFTVK
jgi:endonuclease/exonuclease/phosphatase family metal-dependent hydrolase